MTRKTEARVAAILRQLLKSYDDVVYRAHRWAAWTVSRGGGHHARMLPVLALVGGPPASGKTALARVLGEQLNLPVICHDEITAGLARRSGVRPRGFEVFAAFYRTLEALTGSGVSVVAEAAFTARLAVEVKRFSGLAQVRFVQCASAPDVCRRRFAERAERRPDGAGPDDRQGLELMDGGRFPWHEFTDPGVDAPTLVVDTTNSYQAGLDAIIRFVSSQPMRPPR